MTLTATIAVAVRIKIANTAEMTDAVLMSINGPSKRFSIKNPKHSVNSSPGKILSK